MKMINGNTREYDPNLCLLGLEPIHAFPKVIATGYSHGIAIKSDGTLVSWGEDLLGSISNTPTSNGFIQVACGYYNSIALKSDGTLVPWGYSENGSILNTPKTNDFVQISCFNSCYTALKKDGSLSSWGSESNGKISGTPIGNNFVQVSCGEYCNSALKNDGTIVTWGYSTYVNYSPKTNDFVQVSCGSGYVTALKNDGTIVSWGTNGIFKSLTGSNYVHVSCECNNIIGLKADGTLDMFGGTITGNDFVQVASSRGGIVALKKDGTLVSPAPPTNFPSDNLNFTFNKYEYKVIIESEGLFYSVSPEGNKIQVPDKSESSFLSSGVSDINNPNLLNLINSLPNPKIHIYSDKNVKLKANLALDKYNDMRYSISTDGINYQSIKNNLPIPIQSNSDLMTSTQLNALLQSDLYKLGTEFHKKKLFIKGHITKLLDTSPEPILKNITVEYTANDKPVILNPSITGDVIHNEYTTVTADLLDLEGDDLEYRVLIKNKVGEPTVPLMPNLISNNDKGYTVTASGSYDTVTFLPWKVFNGTNINTSDCWASPNGSMSDNWLKIYNPSVFIFKKYSLTSRFNDIANIPKAWRLEGSNDNIVWNILDTQTNVGFTANISKEFMLSNYCEYKYVRLVVTGYNGLYAAISQFQLYGDGLPFDVVDDWFKTNSSTHKVTRAYNHPYFNIGLNKIKIEARDSRGLTNEWVGNLTLSNEKPIVSYTHNNYGFEAILSDPESDSVAIQVSLDDNVIFPYSPFFDTPKKFNYEWDRSLITVGKTHTVKIELKDNIGAYHVETFQITGEYKGLLFKDELGNIYTDDMGNILKYLNIGELIAGQSSVPSRVTLYNQTNNTLNSVNIVSYTGNLPSNVQVKFVEEIGSVFTDNIELVGNMNHGEQKTFYVALHSTPGPGAINGEFEIEASGSIVISK